MKKKLLLLSFCLIILLVLTGCDSSKTVVGIKMVDPEPTSENELTYEDKNAKFTFHPYAGSTGYLGLNGGLKGIVFEITNKTNEVMKVKWNEASLVKPDGTACRIIHSGVKYIDRDKEITATTIPAKAKIQDHVVPTENVSYSNSYGGYGGGWKIYPIIEYENISKQELGLLLPVKIKDETHNYHFKFIVYTMN